jgi:hypothetical protein
MCIEITITSSSTEYYNCFAWAASKDDEWWDPNPMREGFWPPDIIRQETLQSYIAAYQTIDYEVCDGEDFEEGFEKIAIYVNDLGKPAHAARQLPGGEWTSKIGRWEDVKHEFAEQFIFEIRGRTIDYGNIAVVMKKRKNNLP